MKTVSDIKERAEKLSSHHTECVSSWEKDLKSQLFMLYDDAKEIKELLERRENFENVTYEINNYGELVSYLEIPKDIAFLPKIKDYLTQDYGYIESGCPTRLYQSQGDFISINWCHDRRSYFIFDTETSTTIIKKREDWMDEVYVGAVIANYQTDQGVANDVIEIDSRYGNYEGHFEFKELLKLVPHLDSKKEIQAIIDQYHHENENEDDT